LGTAEDSLPVKELSGRPIVYLDSSDISCMVEAKEERWRAAKHQLLAAVQAGVIDIRFSIIHVMEAIHTEERWKPSLSACPIGLIDVDDFHAGLDLRVWAHERRR
jgi:hypothetical protein